MFFLDPVKELNARVATLQIDECNSTIKGEKFLGPAITIFTIYKENYIQFCQRLAYPISSIQAVWYKTVITAIMYVFHPRVLFGRLLNSFYMGCLVQGQIKLRAEKAAPSAILHLFLSRFGFIRPRHTFALIYVYSCWGIDFRGLQALTEFYTEFFGYILLEMWSEWMTSKCQTFVFIIFFRHRNYSFILRIPFPLNNHKFFFITMNLRWPHFVFTILS